MLQVLRGTCSHCLMRSASLPVLQDIQKCEVQPSIHAVVCNACALLTALLLLHVQATIYNIYTGKVCGNALQPSTLKCTACLISVTSPAQL